MGDLASLLGMSQGFLVDFLCHLDLVVPKGDQYVVKSDMWKRFFHEFQLDIEIEPMRTSVLKGKSVVKSTINGI